MFLDENLFLYTINIVHKNIYFLYSTQFKLAGKKDIQFIFFMQI